MNTKAQVPPGTPEPSAPHPRRLGWIGTTAVAMGGSNQSLFLLSALFVGQAGIPGQGSAAILLLIVGLIVSWMAVPGWIELILMYPNRVGGIAATCAEAFRPYSPVLANLTGVCYWWGWVPTCGLTAILSASAINQWFLPWVPVELLATLIVLVFTVINLCGIHWATRAAIPIATVAAGLGFLSALIPAVTGQVDWVQASTFHLTVPFPGLFGQITSLMAGLYLIGFAAPAFEQAACHVGETINPQRNVPRAMLASAGMAALYFIVLPVIWLGALGPAALGQEDLARELGPTFAPLLGSAAKGAALWFMMFNMFNGTLAPLAGASRTLSQLAEDGLLPRFFSKRNRTDAPWAATLITAGMAIAFLWAGDPLWLIAAANLTYLIGISLPSVAVWLLRRNQPNMARPYRAPRGTILLGLIAAGVWGVATVLGFQQFGLPTVLAGIAFAYSGSVLYAWRKYSDRRRAGLPGVARTLHLKLTGAMLLVLALDSAGYLMAVQSIGDRQTAFVTILEDIFVAVALVTIGVGLILPGMIAHSAVEVSLAAKRLVAGTLADFSRAMQALGRGDIEGAHARVDFNPVVALSRDEVGDMAVSFNALQGEVGRAALGLDGAREGLHKARNELKEINACLEQRVKDRTIDLEREMVERQQSVEALVESERKFRTLFDMANDAIFLIHQGAFVDCNAKSLEIFGSARKEILGRRPDQFAPPQQPDGRDSQEQLRDAAGRAVAGEAQFFEWKMHRLDGSPFDAEVSINRLDLRGERFLQAIVRDVTERKRSEEKVASLHQQVVKAARQAGMADVATSVLHNVGNVLNSVNVSATLVKENLSASKLGGLKRAVELLKTHAGELGSYLTDHAQGRLLPDYFEKLAACWAVEQGAALKELETLNKNIQHIKDIVSRQQSFAGSSGLAESVSVSDLIEDILIMGVPGSERQGITIVRRYAKLPPVLIDKMKLLLILVNLVRNARDAMTEQDGPARQLTLETASDGDGEFRVRMSDNGVGISPENLKRVFSFGFTTKRDGHGFGLHSSALAAQELGGSLTVSSDGPGMGSQFTVTAPSKPNKKKRGPS